MNTLEKKCDLLLQKKYTQKNPKCLVCGGVTNCMHHFIPKSQSNELRYSKDNLIPLCSSCHCRHHLSGDPSIVGKIIAVKGMDWFDDLQRRRHIICKNNKSHLEEVFKELSMS